MARQRFPGFRSFGRGAPLTRGALYLLVASAGLSIIYLLSADAARANLLSWLAASGHSVWGEGKIWQLFTSPLLEPDFISLLFQGLMLWLFLPALERWWGQKRFLLFALYTSVAGTVVGTLVGLAVGDAFITGLDPFIFGGIVAYGVLYGDRKVQFFGVLPMTGKQLTIGIIAFMSLFIILEGAWALGAANASAMALAWGLTSGRIHPRLWFLKLKQRRIRSKLKVMNGGRSRGGKWMN